MPYAMFELHAIINSAAILLGLLVGAVAIAIMWIRIDEILTKLPASASQEFLDRDGTIQNPGHPTTTDAKLARDRREAQAHAKQSGEWRQASDNDP